MDIDISGHLRNMRLPGAKCLQPLFEMVANAIQSIEMIDNTNHKGKINISIERSNPPQDSGKKANGPIVAISVTDNGVGFTDANMNSFKTSDSMLKADQFGCKGVGRFSWLKVFAKAEVSSHYDESDGVRKRRQFVFSPNYSGGLSDYKPHNNDVNPSNDTTIRLTSFKGEYQRKAPRTIESISFRLMDHLLTDLLRPTCPSITLMDNGGDFIDLTQKFKEEVESEAAEKRFNVKGHEFLLVGLRIYSSDQTSNEVHLCANSRAVVSQKLITYIPSISGRLKDKNGRKFRFVANVHSSFLDDHVNQDRTRIDFEAEDDDDESLSESELKDALKVQFKDMLQSYMDEIRKQSLEKVDKIISLHPRYKPLKEHIEKRIDEFSPTASAEVIEMECHRIEYDVERSAKARVNEFISRSKTADIKQDEYTEQFEKMYSLVQDIGKSRLCEHVAHRKMILEVLEKKLEWNEDQNYQKEEAIHQLIFPIRSSSKNVGNDNQNLWIIDERLSFHEYLASDIPFKDIQGSESTSKKRPDILIYNEPMLISEGDEKHHTFTIIEFKKPGRKYLREKDKNPILQVFSYARKVKDGNVKTSKGRPITLSDDTPFYGYVICDLTKDLIEDAEDASLTRSPDGLGFFGYNPRHKMYIEVISYDKLLSDSKKRNRILFDKLGI